MPPPPLIQQSDGHLGKIEMNEQRSQTPKPGLSGLPNSSLIQRVLQSHSGNYGDVIHFLQRPVQTYQFLRQLLTSLFEIAWISQLAKRIHSFIVGWREIGIVPQNFVFGVVRSTFEVIPPFNIFYILRFAPRHTTFYISFKYFVCAMTCHPQCRKSKIR